MASTPSRITASMINEAFFDLVLSGRTTHPDDLPRVIARAAGHLGARDVVVYLAELAQRELVPLYGRGEPDRERLGVDATVAGRAYRTESPTSPRATPDGQQIWVPVQDSAERVGVISLTFDVVDDDTERAAVAFASLVGEYVVTKSRYGDALERTRRIARVTLAAEMRWALLPPLTFVSPSVTVSGVVEPAYDIAGDVFDYAMVGSCAHLAIFDAVGHGLRASRLASLAVTCYRNSRRRGADLVGMHADLDAVVASQFDVGEFVTGVLMTLDLESGTVQWVNVGHPPPLVIRDERVVTELACAPTLPAGLGGGVAAVGESRLQPGDTLLLYTDGVVEARSGDGDHFGTDRLVDHIGRAAAARDTPAESLRRLMLGILDHQDDVLQDDATVLVAVWHGNEEGVVPVVAT